MIRALSLASGSIGLLLFVPILADTGFAYWARLFLTPYAAGLLGLGFVGLAVSPFAAKTTQPKPALQLSILDEGEAA